MNKYSVQYKFFFDNLEFPFTSNFLFEDNTSIIYVDNSYEDLEIKYIFELPKPFDIGITDNYIEGLRERYENNKTSVLFSCKFIQEITVVILSERDINFDYTLKNVIGRKIAELLNKYLSILKQEMFLWKWQLPKFTGKKCENGTILPKNEHFYYVGNVGYYKNGELIDKGCSWGQDPDSQDCIIDPLLNSCFDPSDKLKNIHKAFEDAKYYIPREKELIHLAHYEMQGGNTEVAILLAAIAIESPVKNIMHNYFNEDMINCILKRTKNDYKLREKPKVIKYITVILEKYPETRNIGIDLEKIEDLFKIRNKIAHEGECYYFAKDGKTKIQVKYPDIREFMKFTRDFIETKIPQIKEIVENNYSKRNHK